MSCKKEKAEDRLSALPDSILTHILSFFPTKDAVQTVLIRRFGTLWTSLPILDINDEDFIDLWPENEFLWNPTFFQFVFNVLNLHQRPTIDRFRVKIDSMLFIDIDMENPRHELDSWISFAMKKQVKILEFEFSMIDFIDTLYQFPISDFGGDSLVELKLMFVGIKLQDQLQMSSLRVLKLFHVDVSCKVFKEIVQGCPLLKEVEISQCWHLTEVSSATLEKLKFDRGDVVHGDNPYLRIDCPKLSSFDFCGCVEGLELTNLSSLVNLAFDLSISMESTEFLQFQSFLSNILLAKTVSLSLKFVMVLFYCLLKQPPHKSIKWKRVELFIWLNEKNIPGLYSFLRNSPFLQELLINVASYQDFSDQLSTESELGSRSCTLDNEECWGSLERISIYNASMIEYPCLVSLVETLLNNAAVLDRLVIYYNNTNDTSSKEHVLSSEQFADFSNKLSTFTKASPFAKVLLF